MSNLGSLVCVACSFRSVQQQRSTHLMVHRVFYTRFHSNRQMPHCSSLLASKCDINRTFVCIKIADKTKEKKMSQKQNKTKKWIFSKFRIVCLFVWFFPIWPTDWLKMLKSVFYKCLLSIKPLTHAHTHTLGKKQQQKIIIIIVCLCLNV